MHRVLKQRLEVALGSGVATRLARSRIRGKRLILGYHGIVPEGERPAGERALFVRQADFAAQLDLLTSFADVTSLEQIDEPEHGRPKVAITFDDGYRGAVNEGVHELVKRGLPATIFVVPGRLDGHPFWWDVLANGQLDDAIRTFALQRLQGSDERVRTWANQVGLASCDSLPAYAQTASLGELRAAVSSSGITVGSHTWSHISLASATSAQLVGEVDRARDWLRNEFGEKAIPWLAYPYGLDSPAARRAAESASYEGALCIRGGWHRTSSVSPFARPRLSIPAGLSLAGFRARLVGSLR